MLQGNVRVEQVARTTLSTYIFPMFFIATSITIETDLHDMYIQSNILF